MWYVRGGRYHRDKVGWSWTTLVIKRHFLSGFPSSIRANLICIVYSMLKI